MAKMSSAEALHFFSPRFLENMGSRLAKIWGGVNYHLWEKDIRLGIFPIFG